MRRLLRKAENDIRVLLYTKQPFVAIGAGSVFNARKGFKFTGSCDSLEAAAGRIRSAKPDVVLVHVTSCTSISELGRICFAGAQTRFILWGDALGGEFAYQAMLLGVRAILPNQVSIDGLLTTIVNVHRGVLCFEKDLVDRMLLRKRVTLTRREGQIVSLVAQGFKNKAIGGALGLTEGTVKVYLYRLFKKLGVNDRLDMALYSWNNLFGGERGLELTPETEDVPADIFGPRVLPPHERTAAHRVN